MAKSKNPKTKVPSAKDIQGPSGPKPKPKPLVQSDEAVEREIRRYVKRNGGFKKDLPEKDVNRGKALLKKLKRATPVWDGNLLPM